MVFGVFLQTRDNEKSQDARYAAACHATTNLNDTTKV
jgi:hypothetical protein